jgi:hypothetical protein
MQKTKMILVCLLVIASNSVFLLLADRSKNNVLPSKISFSVANSDISSPIHGVCVSVILADGHVDNLGLTDESGGIEIDREALVEKQPVVILFCKDGFFCGALRVNEDLALEVDNRRVHLARFAIS